MSFIVDTNCGKVQGVLLNNGTIAFKGIRYATAGRFEYPVEVTGWQGVYDATNYGACCYQPRSFICEKENVKKVFYYNEFRRGEKYNYSEDCLFLNVFTPNAKSEKLPVIVYIHGGGFTGGCGHEKHFDGPIWANKGAISVTINYRLGPLGFAVIEELYNETGRAGNYGLYDQLTAINWVKHNISAFGGDPDNITIMGQSAGAMSVQYHVLSPLTKGLISKAVMSSGGGVSSLMTANKPQKQFKYWKSIMNKCGANTLDEFKRVPVDTLFKVWQENKKGTMGGGCSPCIDGEFIVGASHKLVKQGKQHDINYLVGSTSHDVIPPILYSMANKWCDTNDNAYQWFFERNLPGDDHGAWHSADLWYWFGTLDNCWRPFTEKDYALANEMSDRLVAFAKTGSPNINGYVTWNKGSKNIITFGDNDTTVKPPKKSKLWTTMFTNHAPGE
ncbi:MAG: carboxylesterase family protein [Clostridia bacterium]|nr:carboxylesterase family protein [Clostridia bacterium]